MANLTIHGIDETTMQRLRERAARNRRSVDEEAVEILRVELSEEDEPQDLAGRIQERFAAVGGVDLEIAACEGSCEPPDLR